MDIQQLSAALTKLPLGRSAYEFENLFLEKYPTTARRLVAVMLEIERISNILNNDNFGLMSLREHENLKQQLNQLEGYYNNISVDERKEILDNYELEESEYWCNVYGRSAAIELITLGRVKPETMDQMSKLPATDFEQAVIVCVRYANLIRKTTSDVEQSLGINVEGLPGNDV
jgi:hypothetical protein